ncbi:helix-turn-helix domain-containing protein [Actinomyces howellii]|uniref:helix-turn-helix domain-containing protein n=1 Tax=Actinomyces howellii TaxID=52771 RepID=UPI001E5A3B0E|nr:hypothetical protein [Actinomyces howellii]
MRLGELDTNKWAPLLRLRDSLIGDEDADPSGSTHSNDRLDAVPIEQPRAGVHEELESASSPARAPDETVHRITNPRNRPLPPQSREQIRRLADSGLSAREVATRHGVHEGTVRAIWRKRHSPPQQGRHRFSNEDRQRAEEMFSQGVTLIEIGLVLGFDRGTVRKHLNEPLHTN